MELYQEDEQCCGCSACEAVCPTKNIQMRLNKEGYYYPVVLSEENCISCGQCINVCPLKKEKKKQSGSHKVYAAITKDEEVWSSSASGGAFSEICRVLENESPVIFGAKWDGLSVVMDYCEGFEEIGPFRKSKYVIAYPNESYRKVKEFLHNGRYVIYSGTPCQVSGLKTYLAKDYENLITIDFACHGQGSKFVFDKWIEHLEKQHKQDIVSFQFREKRIIKDHVNSNCCSYTLSSGEKILETRDYYHHAYVNGLCMRKSCENCSFAIHRESDITLADFKNLKKGWPEFSKTKNVSTIITNNDKGEKIVGMIKKMTIIEPDSNFVYKYNPKLIKSLPGNPHRDIFMRMILEDHEEIMKVIQRFAKITLSEAFEYNHSEKAAEIVVPLLNSLDKISRIPQKIRRILRRELS